MGKNWLIIEGFFFLWVGVIICWLGRLLLSSGFLFILFFLDFGVEIVICVWVVVMLGFLVFYYLVLVFDVNYNVFWKYEL